MLNPLKKLKNLSPVWIAPILALIVAGGLIWQNTIDQGPLVTITMRSADGLEAGKTLVKYRNVKVGIVETVGLSKDLRRIEAKIRMNPGTNELLKTDTVFWVVAPRMSAGRVSGLETLLSGPYLGLKAGARKEPRFEFELSAIEPREDSKTQGREVVLQSTGKRNRLHEGDPITYHDVEIGQVLRINYDLERGRTFYAIHIYGPYAKLLDSSSVFYEYGGVNVNLGASGIELNVDSLEQLLRGGVCMEKYDKLERHPVLDEHLFTLYPDSKQAVLSVMKAYPAYVFFLEKRLQGLKVHSPVLLNGIHIGEVTDVAWFDDENNLFLEGPIPVRFSIQRGSARFVRELIESRLRQGKVSVSLASSSILAKNDVVNLTMLSETPMTEGPIAFFRDTVVLPLADTDSMLSAVERTLNKISEIDFGHLGKSADAFLANSAALTKELSRTTSALNKTHTIERLNAAIDAFTATLGTVQGRGEQGTHLALLIEDLRHMLQALMPALQDMQQKPNSLIFSDSVPDPVPQPKH